MTATYLEKLMKPVKSFKTKNGACALCSGWNTNLERHHENYEPERVIFVCHACHYKIHFQHRTLTDGQKDRLLCTRHGKPLNQVAIENNTTVEEMIKMYSPPRRPTSFKKQRLWPVPD